MIWLWIALGIYLAFVLIMLIIQIRGWNKIIKMQRDQLNRLEKEGNQQEETHDL